MPDDWPDPREATDPAAFVAAMRRLRVVTDLSYRSLERRAAKAGSALPSSTISGALSRDTLPRADLVAAFVQACGGDAATVDRWISVRADLADRTTPEPPAPEAPRPKRRLVLPVAVVAVVAVVIGGLVLLSRDTDGQETAPSGAPAPAASPGFRLRLAHTGFCLGEGRERFVSQAREVVGQHPCETAFPPITAEPAEGSYRLVMRHPDKGVGCVTVDEGGTTIEVLLAGGDCQDGRRDQLFTFEPVTTPVAGYRLRSVAGAKWCVGVYQASADPGVQLIQDPCDGGAHQVFLTDGGRPA